MTEASVLADAFSKALEVALPPEARAAVTETLESFLKDAAARFATVKLDRAGYATFMGGKLRQAGLPVNELSRLHGADLYLAFGCSALDKTAIGVFDAQFIAKVKQYVRRADADIDEIAQKLREKLLVPKEKGKAPRISDYMGTGPLEGWVRIAAVRSAISLRRAAVPWRFADAASLDTMPVQHKGPEQDVAEAQQAAIVMKAFAMAAQKLTGKQKQLLRFYHLDDTTLDKLAVIYDVHLSTVARWIEQARVQLRDATLSALQSLMPQAHPNAEELEAALDQVIARVL